MATSTIKNPVSTNQIMNWGTYAAVGDYSLSEPITNYKYLLFRLSASTDQAEGGGAQFAIFPVSILTEYNSNANFGANYYLNGCWYNIVFYFKNATTLHISTVRNITDGNTSMQGGIRTIYGIL